MWNYIKYNTRKSIEDLKTGSPKLKWQKISFKEELNNTEVNSTRKFCLFFPFVQIFLKKNTHCADIALIICFLLKIY
ncbi:MAG TPA: hypothetical protein DCQ15_05645 [Chitinophagaceae bacterium]|jgi:hypothetical protein|nr:hypothetical protein [Chitinophagaceae bacterium]HAZ93432.1 hypothetical protein [Chitinophagaceae bacterium]